MRQPIATGSMLMPIPRSRLPAPSRWFRPPTAEDAMDQHSLLANTVVYLAAAVIAVPIAKRLRLGSVLGYLIAGIIVGPWGLQLITDVEAIQIGRASWRERGWKYV